MPKLLLIHLLPLHDCSMNSVTAHQGTDGPAGSYLCSKPAAADVVRAGPGGHQGFAGSHYPHRTLRLSHGGHGGSSGFWQSQTCPLPLWWQVHNQRGVEVRWAVAAQALLSPLPNHFFPRTPWSIFGFLHLQAMIYEEKVVNPPALSFFLFSHENHTSHTMGQWTTNQRPSSKMN